MRGKTRLTVRKAFGTLLIGLMIMATGHARSETLDLGTATKGGGFELFGKTLSTVVNTIDTPVKLKPIATKGSRQNLKLLEEGKILVGLVEGNAARQAIEGIGRDKLDVKVLSVMYPNPGMFVVRADSSYRTIGDLKGQTIAFGTRASGLRILVNDVLNGLGLDPAKDFQQIILNKAAEGPELVLSQKAEALWGAGIGWPGFVKVANSDVGARFIPPSSDQIETILKKHKHLKKMTVPAGTYKGQEQDINSIGLWSLILISPKVPDTTAYELARAIHKGESLMASKLKQGQFTTAKNTIQNVDMTLIHPGVIKYYREQNLMP
jgi:TRAP transporter TAXI family solute receptor